VGGDGTCFVGRTVSLSRFLSFALPRAKNYPAVAVFTRSAVPGRAKTRLIPLLGARGAAQLQASLILDTTRKLDRLAGSAVRWLFLAGGEFPRFPGRRQWILKKQRGLNLGGRLERAFRQMFRRHRAAVVIGTDSPSLSPRHLRQALAELQVCDAVLGPCPDGGFYLIGLRENPLRLFKGVRWSTAFAFQDMLHNLIARGLACSVLPSLADVDRPEDLIALARQMARRSALRATSPALWHIIQRAQKSWV